MTIQRSHYEFRRIPRPFTVLAVVALSLICIAIDAGDRTLDWSLVTSGGSVFVLTLHSRLSRQRPEGPALRLLVSSAPGTPAASTRIPTRATG